MLESGRPFVTVSGIARRTGVSGYPGDGTQRWPAVHALDAAVLFRLALETAPAGSSWHAVADEGDAVRDIAGVIGRRLGLPVEPVPEETYDPLGPIFAADQPSSSTLTREALALAADAPFSVGGPGAHRALAVELVATAASFGVVLAVNHPLRLAPTQRLLRSLIRSGDVGELLAMRMSSAGLLPPRLRGWRLDPAAPGSGIVVDMMVHNIDTARFVTGREPIRVAAVGPVPDAHTVTDRVMATVELDGGVLLQTFDGWFVPGNRAGIEVHGSDGSAIALAAAPGTPETVMLRDRSGSATVLPLPEPVDMYTLVIEEFAAAIAGRPTDVASGFDGLRSLAAALAAVESIRLSQIVAVPTNS